MKKAIYLLSTLSVIILLNACKNGAEEQKAEKCPCNIENKFSLTISNYEYQMHIPDYRLDEEHFELIESEYNIKNDSTVELILRNYKYEESVLGKTGNQVDIIVDLRAYNTDKGLIAEKYIYNKHDYSYWSRVRISTPAGIVWFNRGPGMPEQGYVKIHHICKELICGKFNLNVNEPESGLVGTVKLNGTFKIEKN